LATNASVTRLLKCAPSYFAVHAKDEQVARGGINGAVGLAAGQKHQLDRLLHGHAALDVQERAGSPRRGVEGREVMLGDVGAPAQVLLHHVGLVRRRLGQGHHCRPLRQVGDVGEFRQEMPIGKHQHCRRIVDVGVVGDRLGGDGRCLRWPSSRNRASASLRDLASHAMPARSSTATRCDAISSRMVGFLVSTVVMGKNR
jgi:hypothetical protein